MKSLEVVFLGTLGFWGCLHEDFERGPLRRRLSGLEPTDDLPPSHVARESSRNDWLTWLEDESKVCPVITRHGHQPKSALKACVQTSCASGNLATSLQTAPLDGQCRVLHGEPRGTVVGSAFSEVIPRQHSAGLKLGQIKRQMTNVVTENELEVSSEWRSELNRHLPQYLEGLSQHSSLAFAFAHLVSNDMVQASEIPWSSGCFECSDQSSTCSRIPILSMELIDDYQAECFIRPPSKTCFLEDPGHSPLYLHGVEVPDFHTTVVNQVSGWLDASFLYGSSESQLQRLMYPSGSYLREDFDSDGNPFLPFSDDLPMCFHSGFCRCSLAGDERASAHSGVNALHVAFVRMHNFLVELVGEPNGPQVEAHITRRPFAQVREFLIYTLQKITYEELLPVLIGPSLCRLIGSEPLHPRAGLGIPKEFHAGFFRLHQLIPEMDWLVDSQHQVDLEFSPVQSIYNPLFSLTYGSRAILRGLMTHPHCSRDSFFAHATERVHANFEHAGFDIVAINIMRGREAGLLPYSAYWRYSRSLLALAHVDGPNHPSAFIPPVVGADLPSAVGPAMPLGVDSPPVETTFAGADTTDAFPGAVAELPVERGALLGGTQAALVADVFSSLALTDPFFYKKRVNYPLEEPLRLMNMQLLLCVTLMTSSRGDEHVARNPFLVPAADNECYNCVAIVRQFQLAMALSALDEPVAPPEPVPSKPEVAPVSHPVKSTPNFPDPQSRGGDLKSDFHLVLPAVSGNPHSEAEATPERSLTPPVASNSGRTSPQPSVSRPQVGPFPFYPTPYQTPVVPHPYSPRLGAAPNYPGFFYGSD